MNILKALFTALCISLCVSANSQTYYGITLSVFDDFDTADILRSRLVSHSFAPVEVVTRDNRYNVVFGVFDTEQEAVIWQSRLQASFIRSGVTRRPVVETYPEFTAAASLYAPDLPLESQINSPGGVGVDGEYVYPWELRAATSYGIDLLEVYAEDLETTPSLLLHKARRHLDMSTGIVNAKTIYDTYYNVFKASADENTRTIADMIRVEYARLLIRDGRADVANKVVQNTESIARTTSSALLVSIIDDTSSSRFARDYARYVYAHWLMFDSRGWRASGTVTDQRRLAESISQFHRVVGSPFVEPAVREQSALRIAALSSLIGRRYETYFAYRAIANSSQLPRSVRVEAVAKMNAELLAAVNELPKTQADTRRRRYSELAVKFANDIAVLGVTIDELSAPIIYHNSGILHVMTAECLLWSDQVDDAIDFINTALQVYDRDIVRVLLLSWLGEAYTIKLDYDTAYNVLIDAWNTPQPTRFSGYQPRRRVAMWLSQLAARRNNAEEAQLWSNRAKEIN
jgi:hypothetical protein